MGLLGVLGVHDHGNSVGALLVSSNVVSIKVCYIILIVSLFVCIGVSSSSCLRSIVCVDD